MPEFIDAPDANDAWLQALTRLRESSSAATIESGRGMTTELLHVSITIRSPQQRWVAARHPVMSPAFALAEAIWILAGRNDSAVLNFFNRDLPRFAGEGPTFYGAYGHRLRNHHGLDQLETAYGALLANASTRQVVLQIWDPRADLPGLDGEPRSRDIPCNTQSFLRIQDGKLHWLQTMRSNDIFRGLPYNFVQFTTLQEIMAGWLGVGLGSYTHVVNSLHYYHKDTEEFEAHPDTKAVTNTESLILPKEKSAACLHLLSDLITAVVQEHDEVGRFAARVDGGILPPAYADIANAVLAEAARRWKDVPYAQSLLEKVANPCIRDLLDRWFLRKARESVTICPG